MLESIARLAETYGLTPLHLVAVCAGLVTSWGATQTVKKHWKFGGKKAVLTALLFGAAPAYAIAPGYGLAEAGLALMTGIVAPSAYKLLVAFAASRWEWARQLSGDQP
jgi:hypothetical protein